MNLSEVYSKNLEILWQEVHGSYVLLDPKNSKTHELNEVAFFIWDHLSGQETLETVIGLVREKFDVTQKQVEIDMEKLLKDFSLKKLVFKANEAR